MKKIIGIFAAAAMVTSMFAVDFSARAYVKASVAEGTYDSSTYANTTRMLKLYDEDVKDNDLLQVSFSGDRAGASFKFFGKVSEQSLKMRGLTVWFQPIDSVKVSLGNATYGLYTERIGWWRVPTASKMSDFNSWGLRWASAFVGQNGGMMGVEFTGVPGLWLAAGVSPGAGNAWWTNTTTAGKTTNQTWGYKEWGIGGKYTLADLGMSIGASFRDLGCETRTTEKAKILTVGADLNSGAFYGFLQGKFNINYKRWDGTHYVKNQYYDYSSSNPKDWKDAGAADRTKDWGIDGITLDNYIAYNFGFMNFQMTAPVTLRFGYQHAVTSGEGKLAEGNGEDPSYMTWNVKCSFPVDFGTFYVNAWSGNSIEQPQAMVLSDMTAPTFGMMVQPGVTFSIGSCAMDISGMFAFGRNGGYGDSIYGPISLNWAIPVTASISF